MLRHQGFRFFFYSNENDEPMHVHVEKAEAVGKIWLEPEIKIAYMYDFSTREQAQIFSLVITNIEIFKQEWNEHFS
ncbi:MAG: DUF4160 domain-containing protein [Bacteroidota bacterium]|nr:DUF4160 domain-containing protein [Bacteroidota bacterium]